MEIIRDSLDDISRAASSEQTDSGVSSVQLHADRVSPSSSDDSAKIQTQSCSRKSATNLLATGSDQSQEAGEAENEASELQKAFEEMRRLDEILSAETYKEKEIHRQRREIQAKLWQEFLKETEGHSECVFEALNTKLFLSLEAHTGAAEEEDFVPLFETQAPECEQDGDKQCLQQSLETKNSCEKELDSPTGSLSSEDVGDEQFKASSLKSFNNKKEQKDFIKRNIKLVSGDVGQVRLTHAEKKRLAELLREINQEEEESKGTDSEAAWTASASPGQGYTPQPSDLEQMVEIDSKIRCLLPVEEFNSLQSSYTNLSMSQGLGSRVGWKSDRNRQPGVKVLQDIKERREQETRLQEIQEQLEMLDLSQERTNASPDLAEEQLLCLLEECELTLLKLGPSEE